LLGKSLAPHFRNLTLVRSSELTGQQLASNNFVFIGSHRQVAEHLRGMPIELEFTSEDRGIVVRHPRQGEPTVFSDASPPNSFEDGEAFALITHISGPDGQ